jgi:very-short-patch-repair endonuclease
MRAAPTDAEARLWQHLRANRLSGVKFKRQQPLGPFIVDFVSFGHRLVIEVDGGQHADRSAQDAARTEWLVHRGFRVLRFWNDEVLRDTQQVLACIFRALDADNG